jgi:hypothetical protein
VRLLVDKPGRRKNADARRREARAGEIVAAHPGLIGPLAGLLSESFSVLDAGPALLVFLGAGVGAPRSNDALAAGSRWRGELMQRGMSFPTTLTVREREGSSFRGGLAEDFSPLFGAPITGRFRFSGAVCGGHVAFVTHHATGGGLYPGLYAARLRPPALRGSWEVPSRRMKGLFELEQVRPAPRRKRAGRNGA